LETRQIEFLDALIETAQRGKPTLVSLIRQAVDDFISSELARPGVRAQVEKYLKERRNVVTLREVKTDTEGR
jgi:hypothetical protein